MQQLRCQMVWSFSFHSLFLIKKITFKRSPGGEIRKKCEKSWREIWRVAGRESGSPELLESPRTSPGVPRTSPEVASATFS